MHLLSPRLRAARAFDTEVSIQKKKEKKLETAFQLIFKIKTFNDRATGDAPIDDNLWHVPLFCVNCTTHSPT